MKFSNPKAELDHLESEEKVLGETINTLLAEIENTPGDASPNLLKENELLLNVGLTLYEVNSVKQEKIRLKLWSEQQDKQNKQWLIEQKNKDRRWHFFFFIVGAILGATPWILNKVI